MGCVPWKTVANAAESKYERISAPTSASNRHQGVQFLGGSEMDFIFSVLERTVCGDMTA
jgi:hypothetical protein